MISIRRTLQPGGIVASASARMRVARACGDAPTGQRRFRGDHGFGRGVHPGQAADLALQACHLLRRQRREGVGPDRQPGDGAAEHGQRQPEQGCSQAAARNGPVGRQQDLIFRKNDEDLLQKHKLQKALEKISPRQRESIYLRFIQELDYEEIGTILEINYQSAKNLVSRTLIKLREIYFES